MKHLHPQTARTARTLEPQLETLRGLGLKARTFTPAPRRRAGRDLRAVHAWLRLEGPFGALDWPVEHKTRVEPAAIGALQHRIRDLEKQEGRAILFTPYAAPAVADRLRQLDIRFVDAAGNAFLQEEGLFVWVRGQRPEAAPPGTRRALHAAGIKLLFVLLRGVGEACTQRALAARAGIALGGVGGALRELEQRGWIRVKTQGAVELLEPAAMLAHWDDGYLQTLRPKLFLRTCRRRPGTELDALADGIVEAGLSGQVRIGGELGAALLTRGLRPTRAALHIDGLDPNDVMRRLGLLPDREGDVDLLRAFGAEPGDERGDGARTADPLLVRAELLTQPDDRLIEVAERLRTKFIEARRR
ncbi:MAG: type IV toxin-antitoxin system AbiEi family antitoxin [Planctomycetota bacterium]|nr:type IV toxin-antitoxin system AbiEi family antitoxin [Planctomycetota bacterium]